MGITLFAAGLDIGSRVSVWEDMRYVIAIGIAAITFRQLVEIYQWHRKGYSDHKYLQRLLRRFPRYRVTVTGIVAIIGFVAPPSLDEGYVITATVILAVLTRWSFIFTGLYEERVAALDPSDLAPKVCRRKLQLFDIELEGQNTDVPPSSPQGSELLISYKAEDADDGSPTRRLTRSRIYIGTGNLIAREVTALRKSPLVTALRSHGRVSSLLALILVLCVAGIATGLVPKSHSNEDLGGTLPQPSPPIFPVPNNEVKKFANLDPGPPITPVPKTPERDGECPRTHPKTTASPKAVGRIDSFYEQESVPGLSQPEEGCVVEITPHISHDELYVTATARNPLTKEPLTFCIDSERFGIVILLWSVAETVRHLLGRLGGVGGVQSFPYFRAGGGDYYLIKTSQGIYALVREPSAGSYMELPPSVARAWLGVMHELGVWSWPSAPEQVPGGERFRLPAEVAGKRVTYTIDYFYSKKRAVRGRYKYPREPKREVSVSELALYAETA